MDARCASLSDPLSNKAYEHRLHLTGSGARCNQCDFTLKRKRATLPVLVKYKYDPHPLTREDDYPYCMGLYPSDQDLYGCTECKTVICVECAIGKYPYMKPSITINVKGFEIETASNSSLSRPMCLACHNICRDKLVFKEHKRTDPLHLPSSLLCTVSSHTATTTVTTSAHTAF
ncbi:unnamed protein product, partial [Brassica oleracea var. botrytis]